MASSFLFILLGVLNKPTVSTSGILYSSKVDIQDFLEPLRLAVDRSLHEHVQGVEGCPDRLTEAIHYSLLAPGKRLRPLLALLAAESVGGNWQAAMPVACAVEMIHAYSLIHDDLPAMDDDDLRRGRPTCHRQFDEATAILAGDALQALAFETVAFGIADHDRCARCCQLLARAAGRCQLVGGQADDLAADGRFGESVSVRSAEEQLKLLRSIHRRKTGAMISVSVELGGVAVGCSLNHLDMLTVYGRAIGHAFQIIDDCLDVESTADEMGKRTGKDSSQGKLTYPGLLGLSESRQWAEQLVEVAIESLSPLGNQADKLAALARFVLERKN